MKLILEIQGDNKEVMNDVKILMAKYGDNFNMYGSLSAIISEHVVTERLGKMGYSEKDTKIREKAVEFLEEFLKDYPEQAFNYKAMEKEIRNGIETLEEDSEEDNEDDE